MLLIFIYWGVLFISFLSSLLSFRLHYTGYLKLFSLFLGFTVITEFCAFYLPHYLNVHTNYPIYNVYILLQGIVYAFFFRRIIKSSRMQHAINIFLVAFPAFWLLTTLTEFKLTDWNSYSIMVGDLFIISCCAVYLYGLFTSENVINFWRLPEFWIAAGSMIYFSCELPITGMLNFIAMNHEAQAIVLRRVLQVLNIIMYSAFTYAFLCPSTRTHITKSHL